jgi:hypothetical protein
LSILFIHPNTPGRFASPGVTNAAKIQNDLQLFKAFNQDIETATDLMDNGIESDLNFFQNL